MKTMSESGQRLMTDLVDSATRSSVTNPRSIELCYQWNLLDQISKRGKALHLVTQLKLLHTFHVFSLLMSLVIHVSGSPW